MSVDCSDYRDIFLNDRPMMDARAPIEFSKGSFPGVINLPLMNDHERQRISPGRTLMGFSIVFAVVCARRLSSNGSRRKRASTIRGSLAATRPCVPFYWKPSIKPSTNVISSCWAA